MECGSQMNKTIEGTSKSTKSLSDLSSGVWCNLVGGFSKFKRLTGCSFKEQCVNSG
jgi:hypothetical protein